MNRTINRRTAIAATLGITVAPAFAQGPATRIPMEIWKDPNCGCCKDWVTHVDANGFAAKVHETGNGEARSRLGVNQKFGSCHTAKVGGYAIEGHVPAREIKRLLKEKPDAIGLAVPGMPIGSPGMDGEVYGNRKDAFDVLLLTRGGGSKVYQHYEGSKA